MSELYDRAYRYFYGEPPAEVVFDGETRCLSCLITICAYCQGLDPSCRKSHAADCSRLVAFLASEPVEVPKNA